MSAHHTIVHQQLCSRRMSSRSKCREKLRLNVSRRGRHVSSQGFPAQAETSGGELEVDSEDPFVIVAGNSRRQDLFAELNRSSDGQLLFIENLANSCHVIYLAITIVKKAITVECSYEILKIFERGRG